MQRSRDNIAAIAIFVIIAIIFCFPMFRTFSYWGQHDWDQFSFWNAAARRTVLKYHQFPLWNPYASGGNVSLAHPHSLFLSPFFIFVLAFGVIYGLKIEIVVYMVVGMVGMYQLSRYYRLKKIASYIPPFVFMLSSIYALHLDEGHASWLPLALMPWALFCYLKSENKWPFVVGSAISLVLMSFAGSVDILSISLVLMVMHSFWETIRKRKPDPVMRVAAILLLTFLLAAVKLLPMIEFVTRNPRAVTAGDGVSMAMLARMLCIVRHPLSPPDLRELEQEHNWHEYGAYVGVLPILLFLLGCILQLRKRWPTLITALMIMFILMGHKSPINLWKVLHSLPFYSGLDVPSRYVSAFVLLISIFAGMGLSFIENALANRKWGRFIPLIVVVAVLGDLTVTNGIIFKTTFMTVPLKVKEEAVFRQRHRETNFYDEHVINSSMYPIFLGNSGIIEAYEVMNVKKGSVRIEGEPEYRGEAYLLGEGSCSVIYFSPNKIIVEARTEEDTVVILNQNYYDGWRVKGSGRAESHSGLISTRITPGAHTVTFYYLPGSFLIGSLISGTTIVIMLSYCLSPRVRSITQPILPI